MTKIKDFLSEEKRKKERRQEEIFKFKIIAEVADPGDQIEFYQYIEDIVEKENEVKKMLTDFDKSGEVDRPDMADEIEKLEQRVEDAIEAARVRLNGES